MTYTCVNKSGKREASWQSNIRLLSHDGSTYEVEITGRCTRFHAIIGKHQYGNYICIPDRGIGCELSHFKDIFWNIERLTPLLKRVDAITVAYGLSHLDEL